MEQNLITWNVPNWITIILMAALGFTILQALKKWYQSSQSQGA